MDSTYMQASVDIVGMPRAQAKRNLLALLRAVSYDHRWPIEVRMAYMADLLATHRNLWSTT